MTYTENKKDSISVAIRLNSKSMDSLSLAVIGSRIASIFSYRYIDSIIFVFEDSIFNYSKDILNSIITKAAVDANKPIYCLYNTANFSRPKKMSVSTNSNSCIIIADKEILQCLIDHDIIAPMTSECLDATDADLEAILNSDSKIYIDYTGKCANFSSVCDVFDNNLSNLSAVIRDIHFSKDAKLPKYTGWLVNISSDSDTNLSKEEIYNDINSKTDLLKKLRNAGFEYDIILSLEHEMDAELEDNYMSLASFWSAENIVYLNKPSNRITLDNIIYLNDYYRAYITDFSPETLPFVSSQKALCLEHSTNGFSLVRSAVDFRNRPIINASVTSGGVTVCINSSVKPSNFDAAIEDLNKITDVIAVDDNLTVNCFE